MLSYIGERDPCFMEKNFKKELSLAIGIGFFIVVLLATGTLFFGYRITASADEVKRLREESAFQSEAIQSLLTLKEEAQKAVGYRASLEGMLPLADRLISLPKDIKSLGTARNVAVTFIFGEETPSTETTPGFINFQMTAKGLRDNVVGFLKALEDSSYIVDISSIDFAKEGQLFGLNAVGRVFSR